MFVEDTAARGGVPGSRRPRAREVLSTIGRGATGVVVRGRAPGGAELAIKVLHPRDPQRLARFQRERDQLTTLGAAEGFVPILDAGADPEPGSSWAQPVRQRLDALRRPLR